MGFVTERADMYLDVILQTVKQNVIPINNIEYQEGKSDLGTWQPVPQYWGMHDSWYLFRTEFIIPEEYNGNTVRISLITGREDEWNANNPQFLVRVNGKVIQALDTNHTDFLLCENAKPSDRYEIYLEAYSGRDDETDGERFISNPLIFKMNAFCSNSDAEGLYYDISVACESAKLFVQKDYHRIQIETCLTDALNLLDLRLPGSDEYFKSVLDAHKFMKEKFYGELCGNSESIANCVGHTHIDVAWLWTLEQTRAKAVRSFSTEIALLNEYPEHKFASSQPQLYKYVKEDCPEVYEQIKKYTEEGRWEIEGAMWLEADCNLTSGESLIRQILHGKRFMKEEFGKDSKILWLPDVFGYSAAMPQILKKCGVDTFVTSKIHWSETNKFPYDTFIWRGIDGTEIFTQFITAAESNAKLGDDNNFSTYNSLLTPISLAKGWEIYKQKNICDNILVSFGYGDGGGGVTRAMIERNKRLSCGVPSIPKSRITSMTEAIENIRKSVDGKKLPKWVGELYLEFHRGTYTSQAKNKRNNRKCEFLLQETEAAMLLSEYLTNGTYDKNGIYSDWETLLKNQFHDIIPGSSIHEVYETSDREYAEILSSNNKRLSDALDKIAENISEQGIMVYNPIGITRSGVVNVDGKEYFAADVPAYGWKMLHPESSVRSLDVTKRHMENDFFAIDFDSDMNICAIFDKANSRNVLKPGERANVLRAFDDHPRQFDNWELSNYYSEKMWEINDVAAVDTELNDETATVKIKRGFLNSLFEQEIVIYRNIARIDFNCNVDWNEHHIFVKAAFPVDVLSERATYEIQYGTVERPTHMNTSWDEAKFEVCGQKWADFAEPNYGAALINDCKYGYDIHDGVMSLSLIKCGTYPDKTADIGHHKFSYSFMPHSGDWRNAGVSNEAYSFNCPLITKKAGGNGTVSPQFSFITADNPNVFITTVKKACDSDDMIVRAYEAYGIRTKTTFKTGIKIRSAEESDMMETKTEAALSVYDSSAFDAEFKPYEIKTLRIKR